MLAKYPETFEKLFLAVDCGMYKTYQLRMEGRLNFSTAKVEKNILFILNFHIALLENLRDDEDYFLHESDSINNRIVSTQLLFLNMILNLFLSCLDFSCRC